MATKVKLDQEENEILKSYEAGDWTSAKDVQSKLKKYSVYAKETMKKDKRINIRLNQKDLEKIQNIAVDEGIPYQTLISSLIHKYATGKLVDKSKIS